MSRPVDRSPVSHREWIGLGAIVLVAAVLRLIDLPTRGTWDADQGHDMLVLRGLLHGQLPLLGPPTSIGEFHHGVLYYVLLAPAALVSGADPTAVTSWIALGGILAVAVTGWLARGIAGPGAGLIAALLLATSASAVEESVFIWNPNVIALSSSIALGAAWRAWRSGQAWWWVIAGAAAIGTMHFHVLGAILTPVIAGLLVADIRRRRRRRRIDGAGAGPVIRAAVFWIVIGVVSYVPLLIHELGSSGSEIRAAVTFLSTGGGGSDVSLPARFLIVALRVVSWPLTGLITAAPIGAIASGLLVVGVAAWRGWLSDSGASVETSSRAAATDDERTAVRWLSLGLVWTIFALALGASGLASVVPGLPNDHYHAFADPIVIVLVAIGLSALLRSGGDATKQRGQRLARSVLAVGVLVVLLAWNLTHQPARVVADGGWPAAQRAAAAVVSVTGQQRLVLSSLPTFKSDEALRFPLKAAGIDVTAPSTPGPVPAAHEGPRVILCDQLFRESIGSDCGGPAEDAWIVNPASNLTNAAAGIGPLRVVGRFQAAPGRWISIYVP